MHLQQIWEVWHRQKGKPARKVKDIKTFSSIQAKQYVGIMHGLSYSKLYAHLKAN